MGMKVLYDPDVYDVACVLYDSDGYAVTSGSKHGEGDGCDEESEGAGQEGHHGTEVTSLFESSEHEMKIP